MCVSRERERERERDTERDREGETGQDEKMCHIMHREPTVEAINIYS